jgi:hypothetical protein
VSTGVRVFSGLYKYCPADAHIAFWGSVVSGACPQILLLPYSNSERVDYQGFASENSDKLARAIEKGIPSNLRGMVWQLM